MTWQELVLSVNADPRLQALLTVAVGLLLAGISSLIARKVLGRLAAQTETDLDDRLVEELAGPIAVSIAFAGFYVALNRLDWTLATLYWFRGTLASAVAISWSVAAWRAVGVGLDTLQRNQDRWSVVKPRTVPIFEITGKTVVLLGAVYFFFLAWNIDLTAWLASAGILGLAVGFAAQETLGNLVAGIFILAEGPFKLGDYLTLQSGERGRVVDISLRTTRLMTVDDVEIIVPNQMLANEKVVNESGGPHERTRIHIDVGVAYGSDVDQVRQAMLEEAENCILIDQGSPPRVLFKAFGDSSLDFRLLVWARPQGRPAVIDTLNSAIYKRFAKEGIEIPFPQADVWFKNAQPSND